MISRARALTVTAAAAAASGVAALARNPTVRREALWVSRLARPLRRSPGLAEVLHAHVIEIDADHDLPLVNGDEYARLTKLAVDTAAAAAGLKAPADSPA
jgi:hypothetical protein